MTIAFWSHDGRRSPLPVLGSSFHLVSLLRGLLLGLLPFRLPRRFISRTIRCTTGRSIFRVHTCPQVVDFRSIFRTYPRPQCLLGLEEKTWHTWAEGVLVIYSENEQPEKYVVQFQSNRSNRTRLRGIRNRMQGDLRFIWTRENFGLLFHDLFLLGWEINQVWTITAWFPAQPGRPTSKCFGKCC